MIISLFIAALIGFISLVGTYLLVVSLSWIKEPYETMIFCVLLISLVLSEIWMAWVLLNIAIYWTQYWIKLGL